MHETAAWLVALFLDQGALSRDVLEPTSTQLLDGGLDVLPCYAWQDEECAFGKEAVRGERVADFLSQSGFVVENGLYSTPPA